MFYWPFFLIKNLLLTWLLPFGRNPFCIFFFFSKIFRAHWRENLKDEKWISKLRQFSNISYEKRKYFEQNYYLQYLNYVIISKIYTFILKNDFRAELVSCPVILGGDVRTQMLLDFYGTHLKSCQWWPNSLKPTFFS